MLKRLIVTIIVCLGMLALPISGFQQVQDVSAEEYFPPTLNSSSSPTLEELEPIFVPTETGGPATDDNIQEIETPPASAPAEPALLPSSAENTLTDSDQQGSIQACNTLLWDNGPLITHPGGGYNGSDLSVLQSSLGLNTYGFGVNHNIGQWLAEDFMIDGPEDWELTSMTFYVYQTGTYAYPPASTITGVYLRIFDAAPGDPNRNLVYGDMVTNHMTSTAWTGAYRALDTSMADSGRPIMSVTAAVALTLSPGYYWLEWSVSGSLSSGPWAPPITVLGQTSTGNAMQSLDNGDIWSLINDTGTGTPQGLKFKLQGCRTSDWLWNQALQEPGTSAYIDQEFPDSPTYSSYLADDFIVQKPWLIDTIYVPGGGWNGFSSLFNASALSWKIYANNGGIPSGFPPNFGGTPLWSLSTPPTDPQVSILTGRGGTFSDTVLRLDVPILLQPGHYWFVFYPTLNFSPHGQFGLIQSDTANGYMAKFINPGGGFGFGTGWLDWTVTGATAHDFAFSLGGEIVGNWKSIAPIISTGRSRPAAAAVNGAIYLIGGEISGGRANTVERYDPKTNTWVTRLGTMPIPASNICAAAIGTDIYIPGGYDASSTYLSTLQVYHTVTDSWSTITTDPLPTPVAGPGCASLNGLLYVFGGDNNGSFTNGAYVYNPAAAAGSRWTVIATLSVGRAYVAGTTVNGKIYAVGGIDAAVLNYNVVDVFDPADNSWHPLSHMLTARGGPGAYAVGKYLYVCGGGWFQYLKTCEVYDTSQGYSGVWKSVPALLLQARRTFAYASLGPVLYAIAGYGGAYLTSAERWAYDQYIPLLLK